MSSLWWSMSCAMLVPICVQALLESTGRRLNPGISCPVIALAAVIRVENPSELFTILSSLHPRVVQESKRCSKVLRKQDTCSAGGVLSDIMSCPVCSHNHVSPCNRSAPFYLGTVVIGSNLCPLHFAYLVAKWLPYYVRDVPQFCSARG